MENQIIPPSPPDLREGGKEYRRNILVSTSLTLVLLLSSSVEPEVLGIKVPAYVMWLLIGVSHIYFFIMWRLTAAFQEDNGKFFNIRGLYNQAMLSNRKYSTTKIKAQVFFIRSLPIWAFFVGFIGILYGLSGLGWCVLSA